MSLAFEENIESRLLINKQDQLSCRFGPFTQEDFVHCKDAPWCLTINDLDKLIPEFTDFLELFQFLPRFLIDDVMASLSAKRGGVGPHVDQYDVFLFQAYGTKNWRIGYQDQPVEKKDDGAVMLIKDFEPFIDVDTSAGDLIYIPANTPHYGIATSEYSTTYSLGLRYPLVDELGYFLSEFIGNDSEMKRQIRNIPNSNFGAKLDQTQINAIKNLFVSYVNNLDFTDLLGNYFTKRKPQIPGPEPMESKSFNNVLFRDESLTLVYVADNDRIFLYGDEQKLIFPKICEALIESICRFRKLETNKHKSAAEIKCIEELVSLGWLFTADAD